MLRKIILIIAVILIINTAACFHKHAGAVFKPEKIINKNREFNIKLVKKLYKKSNSIIENITHNVYLLLLKNNYSVLLPLTDNCDISILMIEEALEKKIFQNYQLNESELKKLREVWADVALAKNYLLFCEIILSRLRSQSFSQTNVNNYNNELKEKLPVDNLPELWYLRQKYLQCEVLEKAYSQLLIANASLPLQRINFKDSFKERLKKIIDECKTLWYSNE